MSKMMTPIGVANALFAGLRAACNTDKDALDEAERLGELLMEMTYALDQQDGPGQRYAVFLDEVEAHLGGLAASHEERLTREAYGPNAERAPQ